MPNRWNMSWCWRKMNVSRQWLARFLVDWRCELCWTTSVLQWENDRKDSVIPYLVWRSQINLSVQILKHPCFVYWIPLQVSTRFVHKFWIVHCLIFGCWSNLDKSSFSLLQWLVLVQKCFSKKDKEYISTYELMGTSDHFYLSIFSGLNF